MATPTIAQRLKGLSVKVIDDTKCTSATSIYQEISQLPESQNRLDHQEKQWFNLGNSQTFNDPIVAAKYLLEREYGDSFFFKPNCHDPVFIPSEFMSNQYCKKDTMAVLNFKEIELEMKDTLVNLKKDFPDFWFTTELELFLQTQQLNDEINQRDFDKWIIKMKAMYLMLKEVQPEDLPENLPTTMTKDFIKDCLDVLNKNVPTSNLVNIFSSAKNFKNITKEVCKSPPRDTRLKWFFDLQIAHRGENVERSLVDQLYSLKDNDILKDTIILSSVNFLTEFSKNDHQEFDFLIFSWKRKLIIGIEAKRQLNDTKAFKQLDTYHSIFETKLGDQLGPGWSFFPVVYTEKVDPTLPLSNHYINTTTDIETWLSNVVNIFPESSTSQSLQQLERVLQIIVFTIHVSKKGQPRPITSSYWVDYVCNVIDSLSTAHNIMFYSKQQMPLICSDNSKYNKVFFKAGYGTGKTFLLEEKAIKMSQTDGYKGGVYYVVCNGKSLHYFERKHKLEKYGIHVVNDVETLIDKRNPEDFSHVKAVFFDEWDGNWIANDCLKIVKIFPREIEKHLIQAVSIVWIAPCSSCRSRNKSFPIAENDLGQSFIIVELGLNLRNTKEISQKAMVIAEKSLFQYANGISKPPQNFPSGPSPVYTESFDEAVFRVRLKTKKGILLVSDDVNFNLKSNEKVKYYHCNRSDFSDAENPIDFISEGNILVTSRNFLSGFEWPVVIYQLNENDDGDIERHECNIISRCTSMLVIVGTDENSNLKSFPFTEISSLLDISTTDELHLSNFKDCLRKYIIDHIGRFNRRDWLQGLLPILKTTIEHISGALNNTITFSMLEDILLFMLTDLSSENDKLNISFTMAIIFNEFDQKSLDQYFNISYLMITRSDFDFGKMFPRAREHFWKHFEIGSLPDSLPYNFSNLKFTKAEKIILKQFKFYVIKYIVDYRNRFKRGAWLQHLLPILEKTIEQISQSSNNNLTYSMLEDILRFFISKLFSCKNWLFIPFVMCDISINFNYFVLEKYFSVNYLLKTYSEFDVGKFFPQANEDFWKHFEIGSLPYFLQHNFSNLKFTQSEKIILKQFKCYVIKYIVDYRNRFTRGAWLQHLLPILEKTIEQISQSSNNNLTYSMLEDILRFLISKLFSCKNWLFIPFVMCDISINFNYFVLEKYFSIDYLLKTYSEFDFGKMLPQANEDFWKHFEIGSLPDSLPHNFSNLKFTKSEKIVLKQFKFYVIKYIVNYMDRFEERDWLQDILPILENTIEQISQRSNNNLTYSMLEDILQFFINQLFFDKDWLFISFVMCDISISFNTDDFEKYFSIDYLLKTYTEFDFGKMLPQANENFWKHFEIGSLPELLPHTFSNLKFTQSENIALKKFKFYISKYIMDMTRLKRHDDWQQDLTPILEKTIEQISQSSNKNTLTYSMLEDILRFFINQLFFNQDRVFIPRVMRDIPIVFNTDDWEKYFSTDYLMETYTSSPFERRFLGRFPNQ